MVGANNTLNVSSKVDLSKLSPCLISFAPHINGAQYHLAQWKDQTQISLSANPLKVIVGSQAMLIVDGLLRSYSSCVGMIYERKCV